MDIKVTMLSVLLSSVISATISGYFVSEYKNNHYENVISEIRDSSKEKLIVETNRVRELEHSLDLLKEKTVEQYTKDQEKIEELESRVTSLIRSGSVRLRDPNRTSSSCQSTSQTPGPTSNNNGSGGDELPEATAEFLWGEASRADSIVVKLTACQNYVKEITNMTSVSK